MDLLWFCSVLCLLCLCARLFICALWSPAGKGLTSWLSFVVSDCEFVTFPLVLGSGVVLDCIDSWSLHPCLLFLAIQVRIPWKITATKPAFNDLTIEKIRAYIKYRISHFYLKLYLQGHTDNAKSLSPGKHCVKYEYPLWKRKRSWNLKPNSLILYILTLTFYSTDILAIIRKL